MIRDYNKIAIISTVINWDLYKKSSPYFPNEIQKYVIDGRSGMHGLESIFYMMKKFKLIDIDWLIMADEDVLFLDTEEVYNTIDYMLTNNYIVSGVRDGGVLPGRVWNPFVINTFFSIVNLKKLILILNIK